MAKLNLGDRLPDFELYDQHGKLFRLQDQLGSQNLVIYFYPKDDTPGCTAEACGFRDSFEDFLHYNAKVIGISSDDIYTHRQFAEKHQLPFTLLSDPHNEVRKKFGVPKSMLGLLPGRVTYIADENGYLKHLFNSQFRAAQHIQQAKNVLKQMGHD